MLAQLHENSGLVSDFDRRSFALSGVSGGAVGEAVFRACLRQKNQGSVLECVTTGFKDLDALSPLIGGMMFEDAFARVLPLKMEDTALFGLLSCTQPGCGYLSRALGFEREWMRKFPALADATGPAQAHEPHLVLNSTWVESGNRTVFTTLPFCQRDMPTAEDAVARLGAQASLITAAHAAARFPFINPLGAVRKPAVEAASNCAVTDERKPPGKPDTSRPVVGHLADGGYFDNSGTDSLADLWRAVNSKLPSTKWQPQLLLIRNGQIKPGCKERPRQGPNPECLNNKDFPAPQDLAKPLEQPTSNLYIDLLGPAVAVINVSGIGSHARQASADLSATLSKFKPTPSRSPDGKDATPPVLLLDQIDEGTLVPLGWYLSPAAREALEAQAAQVVARAFVKGK